MFYLYFTAKLLTFHFTRVISLGGRWSDSKGSVINANDTPSFPLFMLSSASAVVLPYPHSWWKVIHLLCQLQKEASIFETFIYWAQKYTVTIYLNENTPLYLLVEFKGCMQPRYVTSANTSWRGSTDKPTR